eukprot:jgi/Botrbrau1/9246/Bobra.180_1s0007.1
MIGISVPQKVIVQRGGVLWVQRQRPQKAAHACRRKVSSGHKELMSSCCLHLPDPGDVDNASSYCEFKGFILIVIRILRRLYVYLLAERT